MCSGALATVSGVEQARYYAVPATLSPLFLLQAC
jgi:hypothetical protein